MSGALPPDSAPSNAVGGASGAASLEDDALLEWTIHLLRTDHRRSRIVFAAMGLAAAIGYLCFHSLLFSVIGVFVLFSSTSEFLLPVHHRITRRGAAIRYGLSRFEMRWDSVARVMESPEMIKLSPFTTPNRLDAYRGVRLRFAPDGSPGDRDSVLSLIRNLRGGNDD